MSTEGFMSSSRALAASACLIASACGSKIERYGAMEWSADRSRVAFSRDRLCEHAPCETLFVGTSVEAAEAIEALADGSERTAEIAWTNDGRRVAFLINGRQLRIFDAESRKPAGKINLFGDGAGADRIARGITFSENGAAVTFDDCPREHAGCRAGMIGIR